MGLEQRVTISLKNAAKQSSQAAFNVPLFVGSHSAWSDPVKYFTDYADVATAGIATTHPLYLMAKCFCTQPNRPKKFAIGNIGVATTMQFKFTPTAVNSTVYSFKLNGTSITYTSDGSATVAEITAGLVAAVTTAAIANITGTDNTTQFTVQGTAGTYVSVEVTSPNLSVEEISADPGFSAHLDALKAFDNSWYGLFLVQHSKAIITVAAAWAEANGKLYLASTSDTPVTTSASTDVVSTIGALTYFRSGAMFHQAPHQFPEVAWAGTVWGLEGANPGSSDWVDKSLTGIDPTPQWLVSGTQRVYLDQKFCSYYQVIAGVGVTSGGKVVGNDWIDVTEGNDGLVADIQSGWFNLRINSKKIPFTDGGITTADGMVRSKILSRTRPGVDVVNPDPTTWGTDFPKAADISNTNTRSLAGTAWWKMAGSIQGLSITATFTE